MAWCRLRRSGTPPANFWLVLPGVAAYRVEGLVHKYVMAFIDDALGLLDEDPAPKRVLGLPGADDLGPLQDPIVATSANACAGRHAAPSPLSNHEAVESMRRLTCAGAVGPGSALGMGRTPLGTPRGWSLVKPGLV